MTRLNGGERKREGTFFFIISALSYKEESKQMCVKINENKVCKDIRCDLSRPRSLPTNLFRDISIPAKMMSVGL